MNKILLGLVVTLALSTSLRAETAAETATNLLNAPQEKLAPLLKAAKQNKEVATHICDVKHADDAKTAYKALASCEYLGSPKANTLFNAISKHLDVKNPGKNEYKKALLANKIKVPAGGFPASQLPRLDKLLG